jgi:hypothetical protein
MQSFDAAAYHVLTAFEFDDEAVILLADDPADCFAVSTWRGHKFFG